MANPNPPLENLRPKPWKPGQSGNPNGSSKKQRLTQSLIKLIDERGLDDLFVQAGMKEALKGDFNFWRYIFERVDGKIPDKTEIEVKDDSRSPRVVLPAGRAGIPGQPAPPDPEPSEGSTA